MRISFCGHGYIPEEYIIEDYLREEIEGFIVDGNEEFYIPMFGAFSSIAARIVSRLKSKYPNIRSVGVTCDCDAPEYYKSLFDEVRCLYYPDDTEKRNQLKNLKYVVDNSDTVIAFVSNMMTMSYKIYNYAKKKNIPIHNLNRHFSHMFE